MELASTPNRLPGSQENETAAPPGGESPSAGIAPRTTAVRAPRPLFVHGLPFIGNAWEMGTDPGAFFVKCYREAGPIFRIRLFNKPYTVLAGPEANRFIAREGTTHHALRAATKRAQTSRRLRPFQRPCACTRSRWPPCATPPGTSSPCRSQAAHPHRRHHGSRQTGRNPVGHGVEGDHSLAELEDALLGAAVVGHPQHDARTHVDH